MEISTSLRRVGRILRRLVAGHRWRRRIDREDALRHIYHYTESGLPATIESLAGACGWERDPAAIILQELVSDGLVRWDESRVALTEEGARHALRIVRAHRLWERHLAEQTGVEASSWHRHADRAEHEISAAEADQLAAHLGHPAYDPHGDPIPTADGQLPPTAPAMPLTDLHPGRCGIIAHVEDEPEQIHAHLLAAGLHAGAVLERQSDTSSHSDASTDGVRVLDEEGDEHVLSVAQAAAVSVVPVRTTITGVPLSQLNPGQSGHVLRLGADCHGLERRRLLDLGLVPGTQIAVERRAAMGDPTAYRVRGSLIALRQDLAQRILVEPGADR
ncbi:MAG: metal-dependent transcriptional regulator [Gemmatimonadetes bacterium]|nr:metal-dependent transcriptional regulator [Gemmatimonadota bacterium]MBT6146951.1 metal-dependent transcriptional regulator [Gemmatimonadota bacterium]MBT7860323.1 metal-dependent transcriptional regulator [Gemmatimonadota bacterium]